MKDYELLLLHSHTLLTCERFHSRSALFVNTNNYVSGDSLEQATETR